ncbi:hypothetical protein WN51_06509 [Melipona quadrifasciata]|uniref:Uncharacterized protein n=1 Tax=Melipona quadrifasciata TaxID=166423 RepID=A0A0M8ZSJ7_9HYME|nr:hypothetical protein WN51_06509 [Melipona quadrifasciata]
MSEETKLVTRTIADTCAINNLAVKTSEKALEWDFSVLRPRFCEKKDSCVPFSTIEHIDILVEVNVQLNFSLEKLTGSALVRKIYWDTASFEGATVKFKRQLVRTLMRATVLYKGVRLARRKKNLFKEPLFTVYSTSPPFALEETISTFCSAGIVLGHGRGKRSGGFVQTVAGTDTTSAGNGFPTGVPEEYLMEEARRVEEETDIAKGKEKRLVAHKSIRNNTSG